VIDWTPIEDVGSGKQFADQLLEIPRSLADSTSISGGIDFALAQFARAPFGAERRTIDVSGDGNNNSGRDVRLARDEAVAADVTVNGLVILTDARFSWSSEHTNPPGGLEKYYRDHVIGGPGAFVLVAKDFNSFGDLLIKKLIAEIALIGPRGEILPPGVGGLKTEQVKHAGSSSRQVYDGSRVCWYVGGKVRAGPRARPSAP
jgi:hypothetical protein